MFVPASESTCGTVIAAFSEVDTNVLGRLNVNAQACVLGIQNNFKLVDGRPILTVQYTLRLTVSLLYILLMFRNSNLRS